MKHFRDRQILAMIEAGGEKIADTESRVSEGR
jgi:hypothetical protein